jgi:ferritin-like protein
MEILSDLFQLKHVSIISDLVQPLRCPVKFPKSISEVFELRARQLSLFEPLMNDHQKILINNTQAERIELSTTPEIMNLFDFEDSSAQAMSKIALSFPTQEEIVFAYPAEKEKLTEYLNSTRPRTNQIAVYFEDSDLKSWSSEDGLVAQL